MGKRLKMGLYSSQQDASNPVGIPTNSLCHGTNPGERFAFFSQKCALSMVSLRYCQRENHIDRTRAVASVIQ
jgi:hypothetical protein